MSEFEKIPVNIGAFADGKNIDELRHMRRKIIESSFRPVKLDEYEVFLRKYYVAKCKNF